MKIAVLGGGVAGLAAAYELGKEHEVTLFESRDRTGGNIRTEELDGYRIEWGPNGFLDNEPNTLKLATELGLEKRVVRARDVASRRFIFRAGKLRELPSSPGAFMFGDCLPLGARLRVMLEPWTRPTQEADESVREFAKRHLGAGAADILVDSFVTGVFAGDPSRLSLKSAFPKLHKLESEYGSLIRGAKGRGFGPKGTLTSFDEGLQVLVDALTERVDVRLSHPATAIEQGEFDRVVCSMPAHAASPLLDEPLGGLLEKIPTAPVVVVALMFENGLPSVPDVFGFLVPHGQDLRILGALYDSSIFPGRAPEGGRLFRVLLGGRRDPGIMELTDEAILATALLDLERAWGAVPAPSAHRVIRWPKGIAQYEQGHAARLEAIEAATPDWLRLTGSSYRGVALNACLLEAKTGLHL
jgi:oxygen-dependent protoporphyrinogen oxidase